MTIDYAAASAICQETVAQIANDSRARQVVPDCRTALSHVANEANAILITAEMKETPQPIRP